MPLSSGCSRGMLVSFNLLFWLSGIGMLSMGIFLLSDYGMIHLYRAVTADVETDASGTEKAVYITPDGIKHVAYALTALGGFILLVGILGCRGAITDSKCLMVSYFASLFLILCAEVGVVVVTIFARETVLHGVEHRLIRSLKTVYAQDTTFTNALDYAQFSFQCCGVHGDTDFLNSKWKNTTIHKRVPLTCCVLTNENRTIRLHDAPWLNPLPVDEPSCQAEKQIHLDARKHFHPRHEKGCLTLVVDWFKNGTTVIISIGVAAIALMVFGMIASICLCQQMEEP